MTTQTIAANPVRSQLAGRSRLEDRASLRASS